MSSLIDLDDDDFFAKGESSQTPVKDLDEIFGTPKQSGFDNLDDIFGPNPDKVEKKPLSEKQLEDLFGKTEDDEFDFFAKGGGDMTKVQDESQGTAKLPAVFEDSFAVLVQSNIDQTDSGQKSLEPSEVKTPDLDYLLEAQPAGMLDSTDDLLMFDPFSEPPKKPKSPVLNPKVKKSTELKIDPADEFFADAPLTPRLSQLEPSQPPSETESKMDAGLFDQDAVSSKPKRSMERSFEDLLHGLSDESEPDIDDLISHDTDCSTNLESILPSPGKSLLSEESVKIFASPDKHYETSDTVDLLTSTPNVKTVETPEVQETEDVEDDVEIPEVKVETPEGLVCTLDSDLEEKDDKDLKTWEVVDKDEVEDDEAFERDGEEEDQNNSALGEVVMRRRRPDMNQEEVNDGVKEESIDLSDIEDTDFLDVDANKHKSTLTKRGSLALRRKPSRKNRRSMISEGSEDLFKDSTRPRAHSLPNGDGDLFDQRDAELSPPAKKAPPSFMMPLPGLAGRPLQRSSVGSPDDDSEMAPELKRISKPPPGAFRLPAVAPRLNRPKSDIIPRDVQQPSVFDKPALRSVSKTPASTDKYETKTPEMSSQNVSYGIIRSQEDAKSHDSRLHNFGRKGSEERETTFEPPALKSVAKTNKMEHSGERDLTFEKPKLRSTPKREIQKSDKKDSSMGTYVKPTLRSTPKPVSGDIQKESITDTDVTRVLQETPKRGGSSAVMDTGKHTYERAALRSSDRVLDHENENGIESIDTYDKTKQTRTEHSRTETEVNGLSKDTHTFEKPALRNTPTRVQRDEKHAFSEKHTFTKPVLRKSPEKQLTKDAQSDNKGYFDVPSLRKTENTLSEEKTHISSGQKDYSSKFPEMKLRKVESPGTEEKEKASEKPSWLQTAKSKQTSALNALQHKENFENHYLGKSEKSTPSWLEKSSIRKGPLQETSQNLTGSMSGDLSDSQSSLKDERKSSLSEGRTRRLSSGSTDSDSGKTKDRRSSKGHTNYSPSWMRQQPAPVKSTSSIPKSDEVPQWKKELLQRNKNRKNSLGEPSSKKEESPEPEWKGNIHLRKVRQTPGPVKDTTPPEPEWKKAAEEKKARLRRSVMLEPSESSLVQDTTEERGEDSFC